MVDIIFKSMFRKDEKRYLIKTLMKEFFYVEVKEGKLYVEPYDYHDRDAAFTASAENLMKIAEGKLEPIFAVTMKKLKVEGNIDKALKLKGIIDSKKKKS